MWRRADAIPVASKRISDLCIRGGGIGIPRIRDAGLRFHGVSRSTGRRGIIGVRSLLVRGIVAGGSATWIMGGSGIWGVCGVLHGSGFAIQVGCRDKISRCIDGASDLKARVPCVGGATRHGSRDTPPWSGDPMDGDRAAFGRFPGIGRWRIVRSFASRSGDRR